MTVTHPSTNRARRRVTYVKVTPEEKHATLHLYADCPTQRPQTDSVKENDFKLSYFNNNQQVD